ncbi:hypothetical protein MJO48_17760 [Dickeya fangzhongdai]|uniref:hypothetical protein n=1 Tax=Dickeya fangzhongdai TaxID=1778540 RepID=UPI001EFADA7B|nr:hypothetical protein [Dickeya fangzhongdai]ULR30270.1 hypothetical protein MJO48_17760 [Dickeya fangzhongdai]
MFPSMTRMRAHHHWWKDIVDRKDQWQGLLLDIRQPDMAYRGGRLQMQVGHQGIAKLVLDKLTLFWARIATNSADAWVLRNSLRAEETKIIDPIRSSDVEQGRKLEDKNDAFWCRFFAERLSHVSASALGQGQWLLRPMCYVKPPAPRKALSQPVSQWRFASPESAASYCPHWSLFAEKIPDLTVMTPVINIDRWWDNEPLLALRAVDSHSSRLKWWKRVCREGGLPPVLVWFVSGIGAYVILDGHYRLQAALSENVPPRFVVLSGLRYQTFEYGGAHRCKIEKALQYQQHKNPSIPVAVINQALIDLYDNHQQLSGLTFSRAVLHLQPWLQEVRWYLRQQRLEDYQPYFCETSPPAC